MKRMIDTDAFVITENGVQFGKDIEVDGKIHINEAEDIVDKNGNPVITGGGGGGGGIEISMTPPTDTTKIVGHYIEYWDENGGTGRVFIAGNHMDSSTPFTIVSGKAGAPQATYIINAYAQWEDGGFRVFDSNCL